MKGSFCALLDASVLYPVSLRNRSRRAAHGGRPGREAARLINPPVSMNELFAIFEQLGLAETVAELRQLMQG
jgi:hypothetical protein